MMRYVYYALLAAIAIIVVGLSVANRHTVDVAVAPDFTAYGLPPSQHFAVPLFLVALASGAIGFVIGAAREYIREAKLRRRAAQARREAGELKREVHELKVRQNLDEDDEIISMTAR